jgi:pumilio RNA-binding family
MLHSTENASQLFNKLANANSASTNNGDANGQRRQRQPSGLSGSIWAPVPQPSETTWPKALDSFSRVAERENEYIARADRRASTNMPLISREDVFGPQPAFSQTQTQRQSRDVGAIGDGRKRVTPEYAEDTVRSQSFWAYICTL